MRRRSLTRALVAVAAALVSAGCSLDTANLNFRVDERLTFTSPHARALVHRPVTVTWRMTGFRIAGPGSEPPSRDAGYFALFVDRAPVKPGQTLKAVADGDRFCEHDPKCPDARYLAQRQVYVTSSTSFTLDDIAAIPGDKNDVQRHEVTVVLMDTSGHRIGESAWSLDVRLRKRGTS